MTAPYEIHDTIGFHRAGPVKYKQKKIAQGRQGKPGSRKCFLEQ